MLTTAITVFIGVGILFLFIFDLSSFYENQGRKHRNLKGEMTGLGIFGTFVGIVLGLWNFDVNDISGSIPFLLEGLKTAFLTSIIGIFCSVLAAIIETCKPSAFAQTSQSSTDKLTSVLTTMEETLDRLTTTNGEVVAETVRMRTDLKESLDALSQGASDQIIEALERVIRDFNENLTEQFGDNFGKLNDACERLILWQEENKEAAERSSEELQRLHGLFDSMNTALNSWVDRAAELNDSLLKGQTSIEYINSVLEQLDETGYRLGESLDKVDGILAKGEDRFEAVATHLDVVTKRADEMNQGQRRAHEAMSQGLLDMQEDLGEGQRRLQEQLTQGLHQVQLDIESATRHAAKVMDTASEGITLSDSHMEKAHKNLEDALTSLTSNFGKSYQQYLTGLRQFSEALEIAKERRNS